MLNISKNNDVLITPGRFKSINSVARKPHYKFLNMVVIGFLLFGVFCLFLPWTQNISGSGSVTTLKPDQRPQTVHNTIAGKIEKWYVQEGDYVKKRRYHSFYFGGKRRLLRSKFGWEYQATG